MSLITRHDHTLKPPEEGTMDWRIFGGPAVGFNGVDVKLTSTQARLLGILLVRVNRTTTTTALLDDVWTGSPPDRGTVALRMHVTRLRKRLLDGIGSADVIATDHHGYRLDVAPQNIDVHRFEALIDRARALAATRHDNNGEQIGLLERALEIASGEPLAEFADERWAAGIAEHWRDRRLSVEDARFELLIESGRLSLAADELAEATAAHPFREHRWALRMLALYRCGRQADALRIYHRARTALVEDLGIEPSDELRSLECAILRRDPRLSVEAMGGSIARVTPVRPPSRRRGSATSGPSAG